MTGDQIGEASGIGIFRQELLDGLLGESGAVSQFGGSLPGFPVECDEGRRLGIDRRNFVGFLEDGAEVTAFIFESDDRAPSVPRQKQAHTGGSALDRSDRCNRSDGVENLGGGFIDIFSLGDDEDFLLLLFEGGFDGVERPRSTGGDRRGDPGKEDRLAQRDDGKGFQIVHRRSPRKT